MARMEKVTKWDKYGRKGKYIIVQASELTTKSFAPEYYMRKYPKRVKTFGTGIYAKKKNKKR